MTASDAAAAKARAEALFTIPAPAVADGDRQAQDAQAEKTAKLRPLRLTKEEPDRIEAEVWRARREHKLTRS